MPTPPPHPPEVLRLMRLAQTMPDGAFGLPGVQAAALLIRQAQPLPRAQSVLCLQGEVILDFADGGFVRLRACEVCTVTQPTSALPVQGEALLLLLT